MRCPGTAPSRENADIIRDAEVTDAVAKPLLGAAGVVVLLAAGGLSLRVRVAQARGDVIARSAGSHKVLTMVGFDGLRAEAG